MEKNNKSILGVVKRAKSNTWSIDPNQINNSLKVTGLILVSLLSLFVLIKTMGEIKAFSTIGEAPTAPYMITVSGEAEVPGVKDLATLSFTSQGKGKTASEAQSIAAESNNKAIAFLRSKGIEDKDITNESYNTFPTYDQKIKPCIVEGAPAGVVNRAEDSTAQGVAEPAIASSKVAVTIAPVAPCNNYESVITGYETTQSVQVKIRNIDKNPSLSGDIITGLAAAGVQVGGLQNNIENIDQLKSEARAMAIAKAHAEAKDIAKSLGTRLGKVVSFNEDGGMYGYGGDMMMSAKAINAPSMPSPEILVGEGKVKASVYVTYEIK